VKNRPGKREVLPLMRGYEETDEQSKRCETYTGIRHLGEEGHFLPMAKGPDYS